MSSYEVTVNGTEISVDLASVGQQGRPGANPRGDWVLNRNFLSNDIVSNNRASYICKQEHRSAAVNEPGVGANATTYWQILAEGIEGPKGDAGPNGPSAYQVWLDEGNVGTEQQFLDHISNDIANLTSADATAAQNAQLAAEDARDTTLTYRNQADADAAATAADRTATAADATATAADRVQTGLDATQTAADRVQTGLDATATAADATATAADRAAADADATQAAADRVQTGLDKTATSADATATAADRVATDADATQTAADRTQTGLDRTATAADVTATSAAAVATAADRAATNADATQTDSDRSVVEQLYDMFDDRMLGAKSSDPTTDNDGNPLVIGAMYWNTIEDGRRYWDGNSWAAPDEDLATSVQQAQFAQASAETARDVTIAAKDTAVTAKDDAVTAKDDAINTAISVTIARDAAQDARDRAVLAETNAIASETAASSSETSAEQHAQAASLASNADEWVSGGSFIQGELRWSPADFQTYRAKTTHSGVTTDPSLDTTNWAVAVAAGNGAMLKTIYDPQGITEDTFDRANHTGTQAVSTITGLQTTLNEKSPILSPAFTGTPTAPNAQSTTSTNQIATTAFVQSVVNELLDNAPVALDTLKELADAINNDPDFAATLTAQIALKADSASLGTAAPLDVAATGDAAIGEVVKGDDARLSDARTPTAHDHTKAEITDFSDADYATASQGLTADTAVQPEDLGTASALDVAATGDASPTQVVKGDDSRLSVSGITPIAAAIIFGS